MRNIENLTLKYAIDNAISQRQKLLILVSQIRYLLIHLFPRELARSIPIKFINLKSVQLDLSREVL